VRRAKVPEVVAMIYRKCMPASIILSVLIFLFACAATQHVQNVSEEQWTPVSKGQAGGAAIFVDEKSMQHVSDAVVRVRIRYRYSTPKPFDAGFIEELVVYNEYDCNNRDTYRILRSEAHFMDGRSETDSSERQGYILPDDAVFRHVCK
jgi:hypothetical protein